MDLAFHFNREPESESENSNAIGMKSSHFGIEWIYVILKAMIAFS